MTIRNIKAAVTRRGLLQAGAGMAGILATGRAPAFAQTTPKKVVFAHILGAPDAAGSEFEWMAKELNARGKGSLDVQFFGGTLIPKELEVMNAVKSGNIAIGSPAGAAATVFPEMGVFLVPYLVKDYKQAYAMFNGSIGDRLDKEFQEKYNLKLLFFYDFGFRHFWTNKSGIIEPKDLRGKKIRVQQAKVFSDTINGLGGNAVPMAWGEVVSAAKQGVIDGGDLPIANIELLKIYEVSKFCSLTYHNYGPSCVTMNLDFWIHPNAATDWERRINDLMLKQATTSDRVERVQLFADVQKIYAQHMPEIYLGAPYTYVVTNLHMLNVKPSRQSPALLWNADQLAVIRSAIRDATSR
jgi:tripartite ATP-independent transporter DctP family solute receptor